MSPPIILTALPAFFLFACTIKALNRQKLIVATHPGLLVRHELSHETQTLCDAIGESCRVCHFWKRMNWTGDEYDGKRLGKKRKRATYRIARTGDNHD